MADRVEHALDLPVAAFVDDQLDLVRAGSSHLRGCGAPVVELDTGAELLEHFLARVRPISAS